MSSGVQAQDRGRDDALTEAGARLAADYKPLPGVWDEMRDRSGRTRPHWCGLINQLAEMGPSEAGRRFAAADRHLRDSGVFYRVYGDAGEAERPWPLSHLPLVIDSDDWRSLRTAVAQRADLIESVLQDIYGPGALIADGALPAAAIAGSPDLLRQMIGHQPAGGAHLRLYAVDVARGPDGRWTVLSDRTQAPSGAGYALENRIALSLALPTLYRGLGVERLAGYFQAFRASLAALNRSDEARVCLLTPGPLNETYFEHAYLARYLGFLMVEGEDLVVRKDAVFVRSVAGLKRADVILRRLDSDFTDPLEFNARSRLGAPGLARAARKGSVVIANALGAGVAEARSLLAFWPALSARVADADLAMPNIATWWCGQPAEQDEVLERLDALAIAPAFAGSLPDIDLQGARPAGDWRGAERARLIAAIQRRGVDFVGQELARLSTMPVWIDGRLEPRPFILRVFAARTESGWSVMPGGFCRVSEQPDARAVSMQTGGRSADVWVLADGPVAETTLLTPPERIVVRRLAGSLPSRAADNLFWLSRYMERTEATLRIVRALIGRASEAYTLNAGAAKALVELLNDWGVIDDDAPRTTPALIAAAALHRPDLAGALPRMVKSARACASVIRDRFSPDAWRAVNDLVTVIDHPSLVISTEAEIFERVNTALEITAAFAGLTQENMNRFNAWRFQELGRRIERGVLTCRFVRQLAQDGAGLDELDALLELGDSQITYRLRYVMVAARAPVVDLLMLDDNNPRSVAYQLDQIGRHLAQLPGGSRDGSLSAPERQALTLSTVLRTAYAESLGDARLETIEDGLLDLSDAIAGRYFRHRDGAEAVWTQEQ